MRPKHRTLADEWLIDQDGQKAGVRAGYSPKYARQTAYKILQRPEVKEYISERLEALKMGKEEAQRLMADKARNAKSENVQVRALENIYKAHQLTKDTVVLEGDIKIKVNLIDE